MLVLTTKNNTNRCKLLACPCFDTEGFSASWPVSYTDLIPMENAGSQHNKSRDGSYLKNESGENFQRCVDFITCSGSKLCQTSLKIKCVRDWQDLVSQRSMLLMLGNSTSSHDNQAR